MRAQILTHTASLQSNPQPLKLVDLPRPKLRSHDILIRVSVCGVCHTELDEIEGRTTPPRFPVVPGHQVVGRVVETGSQASRHRQGDRVGVGWIFESDGSDRENVSDAFQATGRDANGGYAEFMSVNENYAFPIPDRFTDVQAAPLLCAGAIGFRSLRLTHLKNGQPLGLTGFGGSAHLVIQMVRHLFPDSPVYVFARDQKSREFARQLGAVWVGDTNEPAPEALQAIIDTTPAWTPVVEAMKNLQPGGRLVINAIRKEDGDKRSLLDLSYEEHLWLEREIKSVANITGRDIAEFLPLAAAIPIQPQVEPYKFGDANRALRDLKEGNIQGSKVLVMRTTGSGEEDPSD